MNSKNLIAIYRYEWNIDAFMNNEHRDISYVAFFKGDEDISEAELRKQCRTNAKTNMKTENIDIMDIDSRLMYFCNECRTPIFLNLKEHGHEIKEHLNKDYKKYIKFKLLKIVLFYVILFLTLGGIFYA
jgi:hypothetical protein